MSEKKWEFFLPPGKMFSPTKLVSIEEEKLVIEDPPIKKGKEEIQKIELTKLNKLSISDKIDRTNTTILIVCSLLTAIMPFIPRALVFAICVVGGIFRFFWGGGKEYKFSLSTEDGTFDFIDRPVRKYSQTNIHIGYLKTELIKIKSETPEKCHIEIEEDDSPFKKAKKIYIFVQLGILILGMLMPHMSIEELTNIL